MAGEKDTVVAVGPGADDEDIRDESAEREEEGEGQEAQGGDERVGHDEEAEHEDTDREAIRSRRRAEKQRKKENRNRDRLELNFLRQRNEQLERRQSELDARVSQGEMVSIDSKISELDGQIREAERIYALAIEKNDGRSATEANSIAQDLKSGRNQLVALKNNRIQASRAPQPVQQDPAVMAAARAWAEDHDWYDPNLRNEESRIANAIENQLANEGRLDPRSEKYWQELDRRASRYLPDLYGSKKNGNGRDRDRDEDMEDDEDEGAEPERRRQPRGPRITTGGRERPLRKNEVYISAERKQAMIDANIWDDPVLREKQLKAYQRYDREARNRR